jgi:hypothetical protein
VRYNQENQQLLLNVFSYEKHQAICVDSVHTLSRTCGKFNLVMPEGIKQQRSRNDG